MIKFIKSAAVAALMSAAVVAPGYSQTVDTSAVVAACAPIVATEAACLAAVEAFNAGLAGLSVAEIDAALGVLAGDLAAASLEEGSNSVVLAAALTTVASEVSDPAQATQIIQVASAVQADTDIPVFAVPGGTPASPN
jgi:hypothetical protein